MKERRRLRPAALCSERGSVLIGVLVILFAMGILAGAVVQEWSIIERREREAQLLFIQEQYAAAILAYQKGQGALPTKLEQLTKKGQSNQLYLRRPWVDPITRGATIEDWCLFTVAPGGQIMSGCPGETPEQGAGGFAQSPATTDDRFGSRDRSGSRDRFGPSDKSGSSDMSSRPGQSHSNPTNAAQTPGQRQPGQLQQGQGAGASGSPLAGAAVGAIIGVTSKSTESAYNTSRRGELTYNLWRYTIEDYTKEMAARSIPGLAQKPMSPGLAPGQPGQPGQPGRPGGTGRLSGGAGGSS